MRLPSLLLVCAPLQLVVVPSSCGQLVQVRQDFSRDPGWDHYQNRIVGTEMPAIIRDFGRRRTEFTASGPGEIGGRLAYRGRNGSGDLLTEDDTNPRGPRW
jgi:hypothetical protein